MENENKKARSCDGAISGPNTAGIRLVLGEAEVFEPRFVPVLGEHDSAFSGGESFLVLEFAFGDALFPLGGGGVGLAGEFAIEPVFDASCLYNDFAVIPLTCDLESLVRNGLFYVINRCSGMGSTAKAVGVAAVINHLIFDAEPLFTSDFGDPELDAVVSFRAKFPVPFEHEIRVFLFGDERAGSFA